MTDHDPEMGDLLDQLEAAGATCCEAGGATTPSAAVRAGTASSATRATTTWRAARGADVLGGWYGDDTFSARDGVRDVVDGGAGRDTGTWDRGLDLVSSVEERR